MGDNREQRRRKLLARGVSAASLQHPPSATQRHSTPAVSRWASGEFVGGLLATSFGTGAELMCWVRLFVYLVAVACAFDLLRRKNLGRTGLALGAVFVSGALGVFMLPQVARDYTSSHKALAEAGLKPDIAGGEETSTGTLPQVRPISDAVRQKICENTARTPGYRGFTVVTTSPDQTVFDIKDSCKVEVSDIAVYGPGKAVTAVNSIGLALDRLSVDQTRTFPPDSDNKIANQPKPKFIPEDQSFSNCARSNPVIIQGSASPVALNLDGSCDASLHNTHVITNGNGIFARGSIGLTTDDVTSSSNQPAQHSDQVPVKRIKGRLSARFPVLTPPRPPKKK